MSVRLATYYRKRKKYLDEMDQKDRLQFSENLIKKLYEKIANDYLTVTAVINGIYSVAENDGAICLGFWYNVNEQIAWKRG